MTQREKWIWRATMMLCFALALWGSGIIPAVFPSLVPATNRRGSITKNGIFQLADSISSTPGDCASFDASGNITDFLAPCNGTAGSVAFNNILNGTNTTATAMVVGNTASLTSTGTGVVANDRTRTATVATLPASPATGDSLYVTDGASATDCTVGSGSTKVLCMYNGVAFVAIGGSAGTTVSVSNGYLTVAGTVYCGGMITPCTIPPSTSWTFANQGSSTVTGGATTPLAFFWQNAGGADNLRDYHRTAPGTFTVVAAFYGSYSEGSTQCNGQGITVGDGTKFIHFEMVDFACNGPAGPQVVLQKWSTTTSASAQYAGQWTAGNAASSLSARFGSGLVWQKLVLDSTNLTWSISLDGINYIQFNQQAKGDFLGAITTVGVGSYVPGNGHMSLVSWSGA